MHQCNAFFPFIIICLCMRFFFIRWCFVWFSLCIQAFNVNRFYSFHQFFFCFHTFLLPIWWQQQSKQSAFEPNSFCFSLFYTFSHSVSFKCILIIFFCFFKASTYAAFKKNMIFFCIFSSIFYCFKSSPLFPSLNTLWLFCKYM